MSNKKTWSVFLVLCFALLITACFDSRLQYPSGRDTVESWGDGTFQLLRSPSARCVSFEKYNTILLDNVEEYLKIDEKVYLYGYIEKGYAKDPWKYHVFLVLNIQNNTFELCAETQDEPQYYFTYRDEIIASGEGLLYDTLESFPQEYIAVFRDMEAVKAYIGSKTD